MSAIPGITLNNGVVIPLVGFGTYKIRQGGQTETAVGAALEAGYRSIDTAALYGNEKSVGRAIHSSNVSRDEVFVTTKVWNADQGYKFTLQAFETSLHQLDMDYVDMYLIHWPVKRKFRQTWRALEHLYDQKVVRAIGVSNFLPHHLDDLLQDANVVPAVDQVELHPMLAERQLREYCLGKGIAVEAWSPLMRGGDVLGSPIILELAGKYHKQPAQIVLRWHVQQGVIVIPKSVTPDRIRQNIDIFDFKLSDVDMQQIGQLDVGVRTGPDPNDFNF
jgi:diketogulonate reductase-like aldo/keto reductase